MPVATAQPRQPSADFRLLHVASFLALFCVGLYAAAFGPVLPFVSDQLDVSLDTAGLLITALLGGSIFASAAIAIALHGIDTRALTAAGLLFAATGAVLLGIAPAWPAALAAVAVMGIGDGLIVAAAHMLIAATSENVPHAINRLNLFFAFGAIAGPLWAGALLAAIADYTLVFAGIAVVEACALALLIAAPSPSGSGTRPRMTLSLPVTPIAWIMGAVLFLYVGTEFGLGAWVSSYAREETGAGVMAAAALTAGYWAALAIGRLITGAYFARSRDAVVLLGVSVGGAGLSALALALGGDFVVAAVAAFGAGLFLGPVWPSTLAVVSSDTREGTIAAIVTMGNAGGLALPWLQGRVLVSAGPSEGVAVTAALCGLMFAIVGGYWLWSHTGATTRQRLSVSDD